MTTDLAVAWARHDERLRLARQLHDGLGQTLTSAALFARSLEESSGASSTTVATLRRLIEAALVETKTLMWRLQPAEVEGLGFEGARHEVTAAPVRVVMVDDHQIVLDGVRLLLEGQPDLQVVGEARWLEDALALELDSDPDVVLADLVLGPAHGAEVVGALRARFPAAAVLVLTMADDSVVVRSVLSAGARGCLPKAAAGADLVDAVRRVARGEDYLHHSLGVALAHGRVPDDPEQRAYLSEREMAVARLLALGHTNAEIADLLIVSVRTVETYRAHLFRKLGVRTRAELVQAAVRVGLVDLSPSR
jgi:two-component system response regulator NreC